MATLKRKTLLGITAITAALGGCRTVVGGSSQAGDVSLVASVVGIDAKDVARTDLTYSLICNAGAPVPATKAPTATDSTVSFPEAGIKDKDQCALEVRVSPSDPDFANWIWYGTKAGQPDTGLMYGSNLAPVSGGKLALTLYRLYDKKPSANTPSFNLKIFARIDQSAGSLPAKPTLGGNLTCDSGVAQMIAADVQPTSDGTGLIFDFLSQDLATYQGKHCTGLALTVNSTPGAFVGTAADIDLSGAASGAALAFPAADGSKFETLVGSTCLSTNNNVCQDIHTQKLPWAQTYMLAKVQGLQAGKPVTLWVTAQAPGAGMALYQGPALNTADLNAAIQSSLAATVAAGASPATTGAAGTSGATPAVTPVATAVNAPQISWLKSDGTLEAVFDQATSTSRNVAFDIRFVTSAPFAANAFGDLTGVVVLSINEVWAHGFHTVDVATLNADASAYWLADIVAVKTGVPNAEFIVGGGTKYFYSPAAPSTTSDGKPLYFDETKIDADLTGAGGLWSIFGLKGGTTAPANCAAVDKSYYLGTYSARTLTTMSGLSGDDAATEACRVTTDTLVAGMFTADWTLTPTYYAWEWFASPR